MATIFSSFFALLARANPKVCEIILNEAMNLRASTMSSVATLTLQARSLLPEHPAQRDDLIAAMVAVEDEDDVEMMGRHATLYHLWAQQQTSAHMHHVNEQLGKPRNLPG